ncbi:kinase-like protein [Rhizopogon salebrosus TDB-379]|nr:kinase-like protein [Rhizopogon salebrosus TDB-379]
MTGFALKDDTIYDFTSQISGKLGSPITTGSFGDVYRCTIQSSKGETEVAVKVFKIDRGRATEENKKRILRELKVWLRLRHLTIVPLLGIAYVEPPFPALFSQWVSSGTLPTYLRTQVNITTSTKFLLVKGVADGLYYLHSENVVHGDLHPVCMVV